jgi:hypothetical protein
MLIVDGKVLDIKNPKTEVEKQVAKSFDDIKNRYGLLKGKKIHFTFPKKYLVPNRHDPMKIDKPRGFRIRYKTTLHTPTGTETWVYAKNIGRDKNGSPKYLPPARMFSGDVYLGLNDIDEIYFLLYKYSRIEGGAISSSLPKFIAIHDPEVEASLEIEKTQERILLESMLYLEPASGGLSDDSVIKLAQKIMIPGIQAKSSALLRKEVLTLLKKTVGGVEILKEFLGETKNDPVVGKPKQSPSISLAMGQELIDAEEQKVISFYTVAGSSGWRWLKDGKPDGKICTVIDKDQKYEELAAHFASNSDDYSKFKELVS